MPNLSIADENALRNEGQRVSRYLSVVDAPTIATAEITGVNSDRLKHTFSIINGSALIGSLWPGYEVWIGTSAGARDVGVYRLYSATAGTVIVEGVSNGDVGLIAKGTLKSMDSATHITIKNRFPLMYTPNRVTVSGSTATYYKRTFEAWDQQTGTKLVRSCNIGDHHAAFVDSGTSKLSLSFSVPSDTIYGKTISSVGWIISNGTDFSSGFTYTDGTTSSDTTINVDFDPGQYWVTASVFFGAGNGVYYFSRFVHAADWSTSPPLSLFEVGDDRLTTTGRTMELSIYEDPATDIERGAMAMVWESQDFGGSTVSDAYSHFVGFISDYSKNHTATLTEHNITIKNALETLAEQYAASDALVRKSSPTNWTEGNSTLLTISAAWFYRLFWHSTIVQLFDIDDGGFTSETIPAVTTQQSDLLSQANEIASRIFGHTGQQSDGTVVLRRNPHYLLSSERSSNPTVTELVASDITDLNYTRQIRPPAAQVTIGALVDDGVNTYFTRSAAPGLYPGTQGGAIEVIEGIRANDQNNTNQLAAMAYAKRVNPLQGIRVDLAGYWPVFEPCLAEFVDFDLSGVSDWNEDESSISTVLTEVNHTRQGDTFLTSLTFDVLSLGYTVPGETITIPTEDGGGNETNDDGELDIGLDPIAAPPVAPIEDEDTAGVYELLAFTDENIVVGDSKTASSPSYSNIRTVDTNHAYTSVEPFTASPYLGTRSGKLNLVAAAYDSTNQNSLVVAIDDSLATTPGETTLSADGLDVDLLRPERDGGGMVYFALVEDGGELWSATLTELESFVIQGNDSGGTTSSNTLTNGTKYLIRVSGIVTYNSSDYESDALWRDTTGDDNYNLFEYRVNFNGLPNDDYAINRAYNPSHVYDHLWTGDGSALTAIYEDSAYSDNGGSFTITIYTLSSVTGDYAIATNLAVGYSSDNGATWSQQTLLADGGVRNYNGIANGDCDDFGQGVIIASNGTYLYYTTSYTGALNEATGLTTTGLLIRSIRVPYYKITNISQFNNDASALQFVIAYNDEDASNRTLVLCELNSSTGTVTILQDLTPVISAKTYACINNPNALETLGSDPRVVRMLARDVTTPNNTVVLLSRATDGTWTSAGASDTRTVYHDASNKVWLAGSDGVAFYNGSTITDRDGDITSIDALPALGARTL